MVGEAAAVELLSKTAESGTQLMTSGVNAASEMFRAVTEARAAIRQAEIRMAENVSLGLQNQFAPILSTLDRPFMRSTAPNEAGGTTSLDISMHTVIGLLSVMDAYQQHREGDDTYWSQFQEAYIDTFAFVPVVGMQQQEMAEEAAEGGNKFPRWLTPPLGWGFGGGGIVY